MKEMHLLLIFGTVFAIANIYVLAIATKYNPLQHFLIVAPLLFVFFLFYKFNKRIETPKSLIDSVNASKEFYRRSFGGDKNSTEPPIELVESGRYKEDVLATKKNVVHAMVFKNLLDNKFTLIKDDAFLRSNPASVVFFNKDINFMKRPYETKAEFEREIKYVMPKEREKLKKKMKIKKEMESEVK